MGTQFDQLRLPRPPSMHPHRGQTLWIMSGAAVLATGLAAGLSLALFPRPLTSPLAPFIIAVIFCAWLGGLGPSLIATAMSIGAVYVLPYPEGTFVATASRLAVFGVICLAIGLVAESLARSRRQALEQAATLQEQAMELEIANQELTESAGEAQRSRDIAEAAEQRYRLLFERNPVPMWVYDLETMAFLEVNDAAVAHYGFTREEFLAMTLREIRPLGEIPALLESHRAGRPGLAVSGIFRHRKRDGMTISVEIRSHQMQYGGRPARLVLATDVTSRVAAEERLRNATERLEVLVAASPLAIISFDPDGTIRSWSRAAERMLGWTEAEVLGRPLPCIPPEATEQSLMLQTEARAGRMLTGVQSVRQRRDGTLIDVSISSAPLRGEGGEIAGFVGIYEDISERLRTERALQSSEEQLRQAQKMEAVGRLAGGVAHDFNNILTAIQSYAEFLSSELGSDPRYRDDLEEIRKAADRAASLTQQLLAFSRKQVLRLEPVDLNAVVGETERMLRRVIGEDIELVTRLDPGLRQLQGDAGQLSQALLNLAVNARDAMPDGGRLLIETAMVELDEEYAEGHRGALPGPHILLSLSDTGHGMDADTMSRIFEPFFTTKEPGKGTGLGLSMVYGFVRQCGGSIWVYSESGEGTTFKIYLPQAPDQSPAGLEITDRLVAGRAHPGTTILVVEDEAAVRRVARRALARHGYAVLEADNGRQALEVAAAHAGPIDLVLTDMVMPEMRGGELAARLRTERPEARLLMMSGYTEEGASRQAILEAGSAFLEKPFTASRLLEKVEEVLQRPAHRPRDR